MGNLRGVKSVIDVARLVAAELKLTHLIVTSVLLSLSLGSVQANVTWQVGTGAWEVAANWLSDDVVPAARLPVADERVLVLNGGTAQITAATGLVPAIGALFHIRCYGE